VTSGHPDNRRNPRSSVLSSRPEYERLATWLRDQREAKGLEQKAISLAIDKPAQYLNKVEHVRQRVDLVEFLDLCGVLGIDKSLTIGDLLKIAGAEP
jgi:transcriptional regulator with XRE-family HTH domain